MTAILKRDLNSYFNSAIGYVVLAIFYFFAGLFFYFTSIYSQRGSLEGTFASMFIIILMIAPIITMKSFSEEKKQRTDQALLTAPLNLLQIVLGKFLAAFLLFSICVSIFIVFAFIISFFGVPEWSKILCTTLGVLLFGGALIAIDIFVSALTESQVIAVIVGIGSGLLIYLLDSISAMLKNMASSAAWLSSAMSGLSSVISNISFTARYTNFTSGILNLADVLFFISVICLFIFFTVRIFERKRWA